MTYPCHILSHFAPCSSLLPLSRIIVFSTSRYTAIPLYRNTDHSDYSDYSEYSEYSEYSDQL